MRRVRYEEMSKADLLREIRALQMLLGDQASLTEVVHELQVHQEEVKAQEAQLLDAQHALEESRDRYADLFDFAPVGYATLDATGVIRDVNLAAGTMLGVERGRLVGFPLLVHVAAATASSSSSTWLAVAPEKPRCPRTCGSAGAAVGASRCVW